LTTRIAGWQQVFKKGKNEMATSGLLNHGDITLKPMAASSDNQTSAGGTKSSSAGITANDFLTLLVTEMKNQDPTANTDPNQYINQLVNVNSLQQLISINETLTGAFGNSPTNPSNEPNAYTKSKTVADERGPSMAGPTPAASPAPSPASGPAANAASQQSNVYTIISNLAHGNLSAPAVDPAAERLAHALDHRSKSK
jgi:flagellar basal-body rod modification protein FlgD